MTCREVIDYLMNYLDGELPAPERAEFERHLAMCPPCIDYLDAYKQTIHLGREACCGGTDAPSTIPDDLVKAILAARSAGGHAPA